MPIKTASHSPNAHQHAPVAGDGSLPADHSIEIEAGQGSGTVRPADGTQARACPSPASETKVHLADLLSISSQRPSRPEVIPAIVQAGGDEGVPDVLPQPARSGASQPRLANPGEARDVESRLLMRDCSSRIAAFLGNLSVVQELRQFDDSAFVGKLRNELVTEPDVQSRRRCWPPLARRSLNCGRTWTRRRRRQRRRSSWPRPGAISSRS